jgi:hypothetical protein
MAFVKAVDRANVAMMVDYSFMRPLTPTLLARWHS